jgi:hypothetical protein
MSSRSFSPSLNRRNRTTAELNPGLNGRLQSYAHAARGAVTNLNKSALAASALTVAGVGLVASLPAVAEIVYTPANIKIANSRTGIATVQLDINNDGQPDFQLAALFGASFSSGNHVIYQMMSVFGDLQANQAMSTRGGDGFAKAALQAGARIGPAGKFGTNPNMAVCDSFNGRHVTSGKWVHASDRYLGVKFQINGQNHYGWVRMNVDCNSGTITGYAYQTIANHPLRAGQGGGGAQAETSPAQSQQLSPKPASLGALAAGAAGLQTWRPQ